MSSTRNSRYKVAAGRHSAHSRSLKMERNLDSEESSALLNTEDNTKSTFIALSDSFNQDDFAASPELLTSSISSDVSNEFIKLGGGFDTVEDFSNTLWQCKMFIVAPYNAILKVVGWRRWCTCTESCSCCLSIFNYIYPIVIFLMIVVASIGQVTSCFDRSKSFVPITHVDGHDNIITCKKNLFTYDIFSYILMLIAYLLALYTFRRQEPEHLSSLTQSVFLSFREVNHTKSRKKPFFVLLAILSAGLVYFLFSLGISVTRMFALKLEHRNTIIGWYTHNITAADPSDYLKLTKKHYDIVHYFLLGMAYLGFLFFDLLYIAVMINYGSQCQLLTFYIDNLIDKVRNRKYGNLNLAMKEIHKVYGFLRTLNGKMSLITTLIFFILLSNLIFSYKDLTKPDQPTLNIITGFLNTIQWSLTVIFPILLAARLTASGNELRRLGQEIAVRPFYYSDTPDLELQFFLLFTESTKYQVNLAFIPMQPSLVFGFCFVVLLFMSSGIVIGQVHSVNWF